MEIDQMIKDYESQADFHRTNIKNILADFDAETLEMAQKSNSLCNLISDLGLKISDLDRIEDLINETSQIYQLSSFLYEAYQKITSIRKDDLNDFIEDFMSNLEFISILPLSENKIISELKEIINQQKSEILARILEDWDREFLVLERKIVTGQNLGVLKNYMKKLEIWDENSEKIKEKFLEFVRKNYGFKVDIKVRVSGVKIIAKQEMLQDFPEICENLPYFIVFYEKIMEIDQDIIDKFNKILIEIVDKQAAVCANDDKIKDISLLTLKTLQKSLEKLGIPESSELIDSIVNCKEKSVGIYKNQVFSELKKFLMEPYVETVDLENGKISKNTQNYVKTIEKLLNNQEKLEFYKYTALCIARDAVVLYEALRDAKISSKKKDYIIYTSDLEYFIEKIKEFQELKVFFPEHLQFLIEYSDIIPLLSQKLEFYCARICEKYIKFISKKIVLINFDDFEEKIAYYEAVLLSILKKIKNNKFSPVVSKENAHKMLGKLIDELISQTINKVLMLKDIFIKDIQLFKHFFDKIFEIREVFEGESPLGFCFQWVRLEALLEIVEGRLVDIISSYERKKYANLFTNEELRKLITALFDDNEKRRDALRKIPYT